MRIISKYLPDRSNRLVVCCCGILLGFSIAMTLRSNSSMAFTTRNWQPSAVIPFEQQLESAIAIAEKSVVSIARFPAENQEDAADPTSADFVPQSFGAGVVINTNGPNETPVILTNYHVVKGGPVKGQNEGKSTHKIYVHLPNRRGYFARLIAADPRSDLAVLEIDFATLDMKPSELAPFQFANPKRIRKGQNVIALGNPYAIARDGSASASWGIVSNISRSLPPDKKRKDDNVNPRPTIHHLGTLLHVDTRLNFGTSGGALVNMKGELIGLTTSQAALDGYETSAGFAIPFDKNMLRVVKSLSRGEEVEYGFLGVDPRDVPYGELRLIPGMKNRSTAVKIADVPERSPADRAKIHDDDIVLAVNGEIVRNRFELMKAVSFQPPGTRVKFDIWRKKENRRLSREVKLAKWPVENDTEIVVSRPNYRTWRGITYDFVTGRSRFFHRSRFYSAVLVTKVIQPKDQNQIKIDLEPGDYISHVNSRPVSTPEEFAKVVKHISGDATLRLIGGRELTISDPTK